MIYEISLQLMLSTSVERFGAAGIQFWLAGNCLAARIIFHFQEGDVVPNRQKSFDNLRKNWMYKKIPSMYSSRTKYFRHGNICFVQNGFVFPIAWGKFKWADRRTQHNKTIHSSWESIIEFICWLNAFFWKKRKQKLCHCFRAGQKQIFSFFSSTN